VNQISNSKKRKILVLGSGPIVIGQGAEFDYSGTQAIRTLKGLGHEVILINPNPATIMTDPEFADRVYFEPLNLESLLRVAYREMPDALLPTLGGQTALNLAVEFAESGHAEKIGIEFLGTSLKTIQLAEDRDLFQKLLIELKEPEIPGKSCETVEDAVAIAAKLEYPVVVRPAFTLGGTGGGIVANEIELREIVSGALKLSEIGQCLIEKSLYGYKEIEYEVIRDRFGASIIVCNMENFDPVGIHTGDSIVCAPAQTLTDQLHQRLRNACFRIVEALGVQGGCNVQFAVDPNSDAYFVIEVNPRVSRSSALASKATGYPIARVSTMLALGMGLHEIQNEVTGSTVAYFEPALDYVALKFPRFAFDKFPTADKRLGTQMKATGEVMSLGRTYIEALHKAVRSLELPRSSPRSLYESLPITDLNLETKVEIADDERIFYIAECFRRGWTVDRVQSLSHINTFFLRPIAESVLAMESIRGKKEISDEELRFIRRCGVLISSIAAICNVSETDLKDRCNKLGLATCYRMVDTCAGEFGTRTGYFYSTVGEQNEALAGNKKKAIILGSGPIRIGQGIEFDYSTVHVVQALKERGIEAIVINNNPGTVSTDFNCSDRLYFEPLFPEDVMNVIKNEKASGELLGVFVQFGGQTALQLAKFLDDARIPILGSSWKSIERAEDRALFEEACAKINVPRPLGAKFKDKSDAIPMAKKLGYPLIIRPSFVLGGRAMEIVWNENELDQALDTLIPQTRGLDLYMDQFLFGKESEVELISDGQTCFVPGIMEHVEKAGVHSGDSMAVYPTQTLSAEEQRQILDYSKRLTRELGLIGPVNFQFVSHHDSITVLEVNPRASRTLPFLSKITGIPLARVAARVLLGEKLKDMGYPDGVLKPTSKIAIKAPVFSFRKLKGVEISLSPEMKSTGEVMGVDDSYTRALAKAMIASGFKLIPYGRILLTVADRDKAEATRLVAKLFKLGFHVVATPGTAKFLREQGFIAGEIPKIGDVDDSLLGLIRSEKVAIVVNTMSRDRRTQSDGAKMRRLCVDRGIPCFTSLDTAHAFADSIASMSFTTEPLDVTTGKNNGTNV